MKCDNGCKGVGTRAEKIELRPELAGLTLCDDCAESIAAQPGMAGLVRGFLGDCEEIAAAYPGGHEVAP